MNTNTNTKTSKILIVDDHPIVRHGLSQLIQNEPDLEVCGEASDAGEALKALEAGRPDLVIVDISLNGGNGLELIKQIKYQDESIRMLVSSMHDESFYAERALRAGAMGYINKEEASEKLLVAIRQVLRGKIYLSDHMSDRMLHHVVVGGEDADRSPVETLSDRELEVFELIGQGLSTRQIGKNLHLSPKTIETYREHIKTKLNLKSGVELVHYAVKWQLEGK